MRVPTVQARPAATVMLIRDSDEGIEVLMVLRPARGFFGGLTVFPGGAVDPEDESDVAAEVVAGDGPDRTYRVAALRELAEETGLALTRSGLVESPVGRGLILFRAMRDAGLELDGERLTLVSRWVTPEVAPKRFDTRFFLARANDAPAVRLDTDELVGHMWVTPASALTRQETGELSMFRPTTAHLRWLHRRADVDEALASARGADARSLIQPERMDDGSIVPVHLPTET